MYRVTTEGGVRFLRLLGEGAMVKWRSDCETCVKYGGANPQPGSILFWPGHEAMRNCRSGGRDHCTCDGCF